MKNSYFIPTALAVLLLTAAHPAHADTPTVQFSGQVVDGQTMKPVTQYNLQWGVVSEKDGKIQWGFGLTGSSKWHDGQFNEQTGWKAGQKVALRVIADGYVPQPVTAEPLNVPGVAKDLVVKLSRGRELRGVVFDQAGTPLEGAKLYLAGAQPLEVHDGSAPSYKGSQTSTEDGGEFVLSGFDPSAGQRLVVVSPSGLAHVVSNPTNDAQTIVRLPAPGKIVVRYDIAGDLDEATLRIELKSWEMPEWKGVNVVRSATVPNHGEAEIRDLAPGTYDFIRLKPRKLKHMEHGVFCDRRTVIVKPDSTQTIDLTRPKGKLIIGEVVGLKEAGAPGALITIRSPEATGEPRALDEWRLPIYDGTACTAADPHFKSAALVPGTYTISAEAYLPETAEERTSTGWRLPAYFAAVKVTVPADGEPQPVKLEMKRYKPQNK